MMKLLLAALVSLGFSWHPVRSGVWISESIMRHSGPLSVVRAVAVRVTLSSHQLSLAAPMAEDGARTIWTIDSIPDDAVIALNTGQFSFGFPWGWVVRNGEEIQPPGTGALGMALVVDSSGKVSLVTSSEIASRRGHVVNAFQSYPALIVDGELPWELRAPGRGVDLTHRDSRLAICTLDDGSLVILLTRFTALGNAGSTLPWGPTVPEIAEHMLALGCRRAMLLDGGISSQLVVRNDDGTLRRWPNWRPVPLAMVIRPATLATGTALLRDD
jgi:hypothetical protein